ncbi:MAG: endopeptidase La [Bacteroidetes bacterium RIFOXYA12_FULL_35_11]|nr:MAG: endopeptidase La [Bacteroidetes bacterium GWF2_35_48]OFY75334.1 MAG: endopeptidase La [Bacteroidetes bacterium RIFOXYA12_FULL_35_11]HBX53465.1 endopeptidase La [Bacteroidales bacterium]
MSTKIEIGWGSIAESDIPEDAEIIPIISDDMNELIKDADIPDILPILPLRNTVLFPGVVLPISVNRSKSVKLIREVYKGNKIIGTVSQKDISVESPEINDLNMTGTLAHIFKIIEMPDESTTVIIQGQKRLKINSFVSEDPYFKGNISILPEILPEKKDKEFEAIISSLKDISIKIINLTSHIPHEAAFAVKTIDNFPFLVNFICSNSDLKPEEKQKLLETDDLKARATLLLEYLNRELQMLELKMNIQSKVKVELDKQQKEYLLHQQIKTIQEELGGNPVEKEAEELKNRAKEKKWNKEIATLFEKEVTKLQRMNQAAPDYSIQLNYIQTLLDLPWNEYTEDKFDLKKAEKILNDDHFGLEKIKERILEHLAVLKLKGDMKAPILCLFGPPGVGKTSLGKSVAKALGRKYIRISLGGLHDEAEIRGHRKTYIGALPGRIIQNIKKVKSANPVFMLDEIDKVGNDFRGDPSSALLEVLDPEQNNAFHDNYLEAEFDLSRVMFIATANTTATISPALRDRMEMINVTGYIVEEKIQIAKRHIIPRLLEDHGMKKKQLVFPDNVIEIIIDKYTRESGVRELEKKMAKVIRRIAKNIAFGKRTGKDITEKMIFDILGPQEYLKENYQGNDFAGVVTGLAWTSAGGEILYIETSVSKGKGGLTLTGNLGEVMKESAVIALEYIKAHAEILKINSAIFDHWNVHVHVPEGAIPKDGPSAGIAMVTSLASAFTQRKVKPFIAMTGEITLRGRVLPVGGIKEKILAAKRAGIKEILLSAENKKDIDDIAAIYVKGLKFHYVKTILDVLKYALLKEKVETPVNLLVEEKKA